MEVYTVEEISNNIKDLIERDALMQNVWVQGEVGDLHRARSGHLYFSLRGALTSMLRCVMFRNAYSSRPLEIGDAVVIHGKVSIYQARGDLQIIADIIQPEGVGPLQLKLEELRLKLEKEGLLEPTRKRSLPIFPKRVCVITSSTGSVWHDIKSIAARRYPLVELVLCSSPVQGEMAVPGIIEGLVKVNNLSGIDVIILARGGGALEDLWSFNDESVARAIHASKVPVVSAIGHETDETISDLVSDVRASTPSAAAELVFPDRESLMERILTLERIITKSISNQLNSKVDRLQKVLDILERFQPDIDDLKIQIDDLMRAAGSSYEHNLDINKTILESLEKRLESLSPRDILCRGYAIVETKEERTIVRDTTELKAGNKVHVTVHRGVFGAKVESVKTVEQ